MSRLPNLTWQQVVRALEQAGFVFDRQRGSHMVYYHPETNCTVVVPRHRDIKKGTLREILREANLTREEFRRFLD
ncbi:MAG: type II toxin-antitoxin system HicA family toxin [Dehalococcoidia bacterium]|nr:type II toxin-antitoxin system HicA family toxin [Dehalococcoidia bacterium]